MYIIYKYIVYSIQTIYKKYNEIENSRLYIREKFVCGMKYGNNEKDEEIKYFIQIIFHRKIIKCNNNTYVFP